MNIYSDLAAKIISQQEGIIGPLAIEQAHKVAGIQFDWPTHTIIFVGDESIVINNLIEQYKNFFGQASVEMCKEAVKDSLYLVPSEKVPILLR